MTKSAAAIAILCIPACLPPSAGEAAPATAAPAAIEAEGPGDDGLAERVLGWFAERDGQEPAGERREQVLSLLAGAPAPPMPEREAAEAKDAPEESAMALDSAFGRIASEAPSPSPAPPAEDERSRRQDVDDELAAAPANAPPAPAGRFALAAGAGFGPVRLDHLALGLAMQDDLLAAACVGLAPLSPPTPWRKAWASVAAGPWKRVVGTDGAPLLESLLVDAPAPSGPADLVLLFDETPIYGQRAVRQGPLCLLDSSATPFEIAEESLVRHDGDGDGRLSRLERAVAMAPLAPESPGTEETQ